MKALFLLGIASLALSQLGACEIEQENTTIETSLASRAGCPCKERKEETTKEETTLSCVESDKEGETTLSCVESDKEGETTLSCVESDKEGETTLSCVECGNDCDDNKDTVLSFLACPKCK